MSNSNKFKSNPALPNLRSSSAQVLKLFLLQKGDPVFAEEIEDTDEEFSVRNAVKKLQILGWPIEIYQNYLDHSGNPTQNYKLDVCCISPGAWSDAQIFLKKLEK